VRKDQWVFKSYLKTFDGDPKTLPLRIAASARV
jgi:hypothetical protein